MRRAGRAADDGGAEGRGYLPIDGIAAYDKAVQGLVFGPDSAAVKQSRVATVQALGGTGGLKLGADFLKRLHPGAGVLISDPSWENHRALFTNAGFTVSPIPTTPRRARRAWTPKACSPRWGQRRPARSSYCMPAATTRPATTSRPSSGLPVVETVKARRSGGLPRHGLPGFRRGHRRGRRGRPAVPGGRHRLPGVDLVLQELLALWRAGRRAERGLRERRRGLAGAQPAEDRHPHRTTATRPPMARRWSPPC